MLTGKVALVTGGSKGIGAAAAVKLASLGAKVALVYASNQEAAEQVVAKCQAQGTQALALQGDVADFGAVKQMVAQVKEQWGTVDILVNNAGITQDGLVAMLSESKFDQVIATNLKGAFNFIRHCTPLFLRNQGGKIINISSIAGIMGNAGQANYSASKAGLIGLTKAVARELAPKNITCNAVAPGVIQTDMTQDLPEDGFVIPLKRRGTPEEVAEVIAFLASPASDYITGEVIRVDGGLAI